MGGLLPVPLGKSGFHCWGGGGSIEPPNMGGRGFGKKAELTGPLISH